MVEESVGDVESLGSMRSVERVRAHALNVSLVHLELRLVQILGTSRFGHRSRTDSHLTSDGSAVAG